jgi:hypothetical protein
MSLGNAGDRRRRGGLANRFDRPTRIAFVSPIAMTHRAQATHRDW